MGAQAAADHGVVVDWRVSIRWVFRSTGTASGTTTTTCSETCSAPSSEGASPS
jgi:hypothetical protein